MTYAEIRADYRRLLEAKRLKWNADFEVRRHEHNPDFFARQTEEWKDDLAYLRGVQDRRANEERTISYEMMEKYSPRIYARMDDFTWLYT